MEYGEYGERSLPSKNWWESWQFSQIMCRIIIEHASPLMQSLSRHMLKQKNICRLNSPPPLSCLTLHLGFYYRIKGERPFISLYKFRAVIADNDLMRTATLLIFLLMLSAINGNNEGSVMCISYPFHTHSILIQYPFHTTKQVSHEWWIEPIL